MSVVPILVAAALLVLALAFGLHCLVLHCDQRRNANHELDPERESPYRSA